ncbi:helix-turn-helix transcriptional regulator [Campylobacter sp. faydin G-24]|uniref:Helix-turn-helix transcriptional regulator n=1 Tax=Campylobacter anatolicus TaxID=2829105 RepID=A0ABS5HH88_9BACT|nr:helix-turn-helix transcriptional regulator [Campylobacter anatolicus]MBR8463643.1 helix-turn-helix transcriptional regulator [Campylobacter anatolicus]
MSRDDFNKLLKQANLSRKEFAEIIGMQYNSVNNWGSSQDFPRWVESWLTNYIKSTKFDKAKKIFDDEFAE